MSSSVMSSWVRLATCFAFFVLIFAMAVVGQQTMDELISGAADTPQQMFAMPQPLTDGKPSVVQVELDMLFTRAQWNNIQRQQGSGGRKKRKAIRGDDFRWPRGEVPYQFDNTYWSAKDREEIQKAMDEWHAYTCLRFVPAQPHHQYKISIINAGGCFSNVGLTRSPSDQVLGLAKGCRWKSVVVHELGHSVGFQHEQTRPDRDDFVTIVEQNIPPNLRYNFQKYSTRVVDTRQIPYDYRSVMHYGPKAFSINKQPTIVTKDARYQNVIGTASRLSYLDIKLANDIYSCAPANCPRVSCRGYLDKNCQCMCPGDPVEGDPVVPCSGTPTSTGSGSGSGSVTQSPTARPKTTTTTRTTGEEECTNMYSQCDQWADRGECRHPVNKDYMAAYCKKACHLCGKEPEKERCRDTGEYCDFWKGEGHCTSTYYYGDFMKIKCPLTCGFCRPSHSGVDSVVANVDPDYDVNNGSGVMTQSMLWNTLLCVLVTIFALH